MEENFKNIPGFDGEYQVSDMGRVKSLDRWVKCKSGESRFYKGKTLKSTSDEYGRVSVGLSKKGKRKQYRIHCLVMLAFVGERPKGYSICHKDGDASNNTLSNLRYDTQSENSIDIYRQSEKSGMGKLSIEEVLEIRRLYKDKGFTYERLGKMFNVSIGAIGKIITRKHFPWLNDDGSIEKGA